MILSGPVRLTIPCEQLVSRTCSIEKQTVACAGFSFVWRILIMRRNQLLAGTLKRTWAPRCVQDGQKKERSYEYVHPISFIELECVTDSTQCLFLSVILQ